MTVDFTKFPFPTIVHPETATLTEAITADPVDSGFVIITVKAADVPTATDAVQSFAATVRAGAADSALVDMTAYRQLRRDELGGAMPFDQPICEAIVAAVARRGEGEIGLHVMADVFENQHADAILLLGYRTPQAATDAVQAFAGGLHAGFNQLAKVAATHSVGAFKNMKRYSSVSRDPNVIQFFNLFDAPGDLDTLWTAWQEALPWFFEIAEFRSSFPLLALDPGQDILLVNYAHLDSAKHFLHAELHDPALPEIIANCYLRRKITLPTPFFCKIVPV